MAGFDLQQFTSGVTQTAGAGSVLGAISIGANFIPGVGQVASSAIQIFSAAVSAFEGWLGLGAGRQEADLIVPVQNNLVARLGQITDKILVGRNPSVSELQGYYRELWQLAVGFMEFCLQPVFTDRRASGQALNTVMPYLDGTCGYPEPLGTAIPTAAQTNCLQWGDGTVGGVGTDGMMGAVRRAIQHAGGTVPTFPTTSMADAANSGYDVTELPPPSWIEPWLPGGGGPIMMGQSSLLPVLVGAAALFLYSRRR